MALKKFVLVPTKQPASVPAKPPAKAVTNGAGPSIPPPGIPDDLPEQFDLWSRKQLMAVCQYMGAAQDAVVGKTIKDLRSLYKDLYDASQQSAG